MRREAGRWLGPLALHGSRTRRVKTSLGLLRELRRGLTSSRHLAAPFLLAAGLLGIASCSDGTIRSPSASGPVSSPGVSIPAQELPPDIQCYVDHGYTLVKIMDPTFEGDRPGYQLSTDLPADQIGAIHDQCEKLAPPYIPKTDDELRVIYDRWVDERDCLIELGYRPAPPPSFEKFAADWRSTGPWMPIDGVDTGSWSDAEYREAKDRCKLEFFSRD